MTTFALVLENGDSSLSSEVYRLRPCFGAMNKQGGYGKPIHSVRYLYSMEGQWHQPLFGGMDAAYKRHLMEFKPHPTAYKELLQEYFSLINKQWPGLIPHRTPIKSRKTFGGDLAPKYADTSPPFSYMEFNARRYTNIGMYIGLSTLRQGIEYPDKIKNIMHLYKNYKCSFITALVLANCITPWKYQMGDPSVLYSEIAYKWTYTRPVSDHAPIGYWYNKDEINYLASGIWNDTEEFPTFRVRTWWENIQGLATHGPSWRCLTTVDTQNIIEKELNIPFTVPTNNNRTGAIHIYDYKYLEDLVKLVDSWALAGGNSNV